MDKKVEVSEIWEWTEIQIIKERQKLPKIVNILDTTVTANDNGKKYLEYKVMKKDFVSH